MDKYLPYIHTALWFIITVALIYVGKRNKLGAIAYVGSGMFFVMGIWWLIDALTPGVNMLAGIYGIIIRAVIFIFAVVLVLMYVKIKKSNK